MTDSAGAGTAPRPSPRVSAVVSLAAWLDEGRHGQLEIRSPQTAACRLHLAAGELRLAPDDPLAASLAAPNPDLEPLIALLAGARADSLRWSEEPAPPLSAEPPLPAARLLMEAAARSEDRAPLWNLLGGRGVTLAMGIGAGPLARQALAALEPRLQALLARFVKPRPAAELVSDDEAGFAALRDLARLRAVGLLVPAAEGAGGTRAALTERSRELFLRRIARELERKPLRLDRDEHRRRVTDLLRRIGNSDHYELLGLSRHQDEQAVHQGYVEIARLVHPHHADSLGLEGRRAALDSLFDVLTEAYLVLSHPDRRRSYDAELGPEEKSPASEERRREKSSVARDMYARARRMALAGEFQPALELTRQAIQLDPQAEYYKLQGDVQRKNPQWRGGALASYRDALRCKPDDPELRLAFAQLLEEMGDRKQAGVQYRAALELRPDDRRLQRALDRFEHPRRETSARKRPGGGGGLFPTFRALFGRGGAAPSAPADDEREEDIYE